MSDAHRLVLNATPAPPRLRMDPLRLQTPSNRIIYADCPTTARTNVSSYGDPDAAAFAADGSDPRAAGRRQRRYRGGMGEFLGLQAGKKSSSQGEFRRVNATVSVPGGRRSRRATRKHPILGCLCCMAATNAAAQQGFRRAGACEKAFRSAREAGRPQLDRAPPTPMCSARPRIAGGSPRR